MFFGDAIFILESMTDISGRKTKDMPNSYNV